MKCFRLRKFVEAGLYDHRAVMWDLYLAISNNVPYFQSLSHELVKYDSIDLNNSFHVIFSAFLSGYLVSVIVQLIEIFKPRIILFIKRLTLICIYLLINKVNFEIIV